MAIFRSNILAQYTPRYLKDFSHRVRVQRSYSLREAQMLAPQYLKKVKDCTNLVNTTVNPDVYFMRYDLMVSCLVELSKMEKQIKFSGQRPSAFLNEVLTTRNKQIEFFVDRIFRSYCGKISSLKTDKAKQNKIRQFIRTMNDIACELPASMDNNVQNMVSELKKISDLNTYTNAINVNNAKELNTDLVEADYFLGCCGECAKYRGRWFSISGKDHLFPKMPVDYGCTCQGLTFYPVIYGISEPTYCPKNIDIISWSNRPFIDDRTNDEKKR